MKNSWWVDFTVGGTRYRKRSPANSQSGARVYETTLRLKLAQGEDIEISPHEQPYEPSFAEFAQRWFDDYVVANNKYSEQRTKRYILSASLIPYFGAMPISEIASHHIERYKAEQVAQSVQNKTVNNRLTVLSTCLKTAHDWLQLDGPFPKIKRLKCQSQRTDYLSSEEAGLLLSNAEGVIYDLVLTALRTGMRQGELRGLQWSSIDWQRGSMTVRHSRCVYRGVLTTTKGNRERHIPLGPALRECLQRRSRPEGYVFTDVNGEPFNERRLNQRLTALCKLAGVRRTTWHVLRHTFATQLAMKGVPLNVVQVLMGHASITTTIRYAHVAPSTLQDAIGLLDPQNACAVEFGQPAVNPWTALQLRGSGTIRRPSETQQISG